jgi:hypothetical protein
MEITGPTTTSCLKRRLKRNVQCHVFAQSPPGRRPNVKYPVNNLCKNVSLAVLFVATIIHTQSLRSQMCLCIHTHTYPSQYRDAFLGH